MITPEMLMSIMNECLSGSTSDWYVAQGRGMTDVDIFDGWINLVKAAELLNGNLAADRLDGAEAIAEFRGEPIHRTRYLLRSGLIPHGREGDRIVASKRVLWADWKRRTDPASPGDERLENGSGSINETVANKGMLSDDPDRSFVGCSDGSRHEIAYRIRLLKDLPLIDGKPGDIANHTGEVLVMNAVDAIKAISEGWGEVLGGKVRTKRS